VTQVTGMNSESLAKIEEKTLGHSWSSKSIVLKCNVKHGRIVSIPDFFFLFNVWKHTAG